jgi:hypothetical protein
MGARSIIGANVFLRESVAPDMIYALGDQEHRIREKKASGKPRGGSGLREGGA